MFHPQAVWFLVQRLMAEGDAAGGKPGGRSRTPVLRSQVRMLSGRWAPQSAPSSFVAVVSDPRASSTRNRTVRSSRSEQRAQVFWR
ncbi:hypothetical protein J2Y41_003477 [Arthrobacter sp. 1088]|uniref:hypothetical protein n=1 Tax=Arthrobacter sp. 1088 TaxID=2817768 RepID=UPI0028560C38|nr:hypothetical protein [Arthrobacter sp. 1088]MDR6687901.1 hypothetical protein [Arthrobacter sp. 1088]